MLQVAMPLMPSGQPVTLVAWPSTLPGTTRWKHCWQIFWIQDGKITGTMSVYKFKKPKLQHKHHGIC